MGSGHEPGLGSGLPEVGHTRTCVWEKGETSKVNKEMGSEQSQVGHIRTHAWEKGETLKVNEEMGSEQPLGVKMAISSFKEVAARF